MAKYRNELFCFRQLLDPRLLGDDTVRAVLQEALKNLVNKIWIAAAPLAPRNDDFSSFFVSEDFKRKRNDQKKNAPFMISFPKSITSPDAKAP